MHSQMEVTSISHLLGALILGSLLLGCSTKQRQPKDKATTSSTMTVSALPANEDYKASGLDELTDGGQDSAVAGSDDSGEEEAPLSLTDPNLILLADILPNMSTGPSGVGTTEQMLLDINNDGAVDTSDIDELTVACDSLDGDYITSINQRYLNLISLFIDPSTALVDSSVDPIYHTLDLNEDGFIDEADLTIVENDPICGYYNPENLPDSSSVNLTVFTDLVSALDTGFSGVSNQAEDLADIDNNGHVNIFDHTLMVILCSNPSVAMKLSINQRFIDMIVTHPTGVFPLSDSSMDAEFHPLDLNGDDFIDAEDLNIAINNTFCGL